MRIKIIVIVTFLSFFILSLFFICIVTYSLLFQVIDQKTNQIQGKVELDLNVFLKERKMEVVGEDYSLSGASGGLSTLKLNITLRVSAYMKSFPIL